VDTELNIRKPDTYCPVARFPVIRYFFCKFYAMNLDTMASILLEKTEKHRSNRYGGGEAHSRGRGWTLIPVSRVSLGFGLGGAGNKTEVGGSGGGLTVEPIAFIVVQGPTLKS